MFESLCVLTGIVIMMTAMLAYAGSRDAFHPAIVVAPPFGYIFSISPIVLNSEGGLEALFTTDQLAHVQLIYLLSVACFSLGLLSIRPRGTALRHGGMNLSAPMARRLYQAAIAMGVISVAAYLHMIDNVGGFVEAYSRVKGGGRAESGYIGEAILMSFPAVLFAALARRAVGRIRLRDMALAILIMSPHLIQGTLGGRRGPLFLSLAVLFFAWLIARGGFASLRKVVLGVSIIGLAVIFVWSQRQEVYLGSGEDIEVERVWDKLSPDRIETGDAYVFSAAKILAAEQAGSFYWGYRYFVTFLIRPIPKQIWPTKYEDVGASWVMGIDDEKEAVLLLQGVGFMAPAGAALPSIADVYLEFAWGVLPFFFVLGRVFARVWTLHRLRGGIWSVLHIIMLALSIYLATQSFSAWAHRLLFISAPTFLLWRFWINGNVGRRGRPAAMRPPAGLPGPARPGLWGRHGPMVAVPVPPAGGER
jgi:hypothetical protein